MGFQTFKRGRIRPGTEPFLTIQRKGVFSMNRAAFEALGSPKLVELLYDADEQLIGLRKVDSSVSHAYPVRGLGSRRPTNSNFLVSGTALTTFYGIDTSVSRRRIARIEGDMLVVDLKDPGLEVTSNRAGTQR